MLCEAKKNNLTEESWFLLYNEFHRSQRTLVSCTQESRLSLFGGGLNCVIHWKIIIFENKMLLCELRGINVTLFYGLPIMLISLIYFKLYIPIYLTSNCIMKSDFKASLLHSVLYHSSWFQRSWDWFLRSSQSRSNCCTTSSVRQIDRISLHSPFQKSGMKNPRLKSLLTKLLTNALKLS